MGLFDYVIVPCPKCGHPVEGQTKGGECAMQKLSIDKLTFEEAHCMGFLPCDKCGYQAELDLDCTNKVK